MAKQLLSEAIADRRRAERRHPDQLRSAGQCARHHRCQRQDHWLRQPGTAHSDYRSADPLGKITRYARDEAGNAWQAVNRLGQVTNHSIDAVNRPVQNDYVADATSERVTHDAFGNKQPIAKGSVGYLFSYDAKNRLVAKTDSRTGRMPSFTYDRADNVLSKTDYQNETTVYTYHSTNQRAAMSNSAYLSASYQHDAAGRLLACILSDGAQTQYLWNAGGQLVGLRALTANGTVLGSVTYTRDRVGILSQSDASATTSYFYDALYRLTRADHPGTGNDESFSYDRWATAACTP